MLEVISELVPCVGAHGHFSKVSVERHHQVSVLIVSGSLFFD